MKLNAFSVKPLIKKPATSCVEKLPDRGSMVGPALLAVLVLPFLLDVLEFGDDTSGLTGGEGEIKYLLGEPLALMVRTRELVRRTEMM